MIQLYENLVVDRYRWAQDTVKSLAVAGKRKLIFDIGAGDGGLRSLEGEGFEWVGFDRQAWGDVVRWDLAEVCPFADRRADVVLLLDVIEHLPNPGLALRHIADAMNEGGALIITTPNPKWSGSRINMLVRGYLSGFSIQDLDINYHVLPILPHVLDRFLGEVGLVPESYVTLGGSTRLFEAKGNLKGPARIAMNVVQKVIEARDRSAHGDSYGIVAVKRSDLASEKCHPPVSSQLSE
jgi:SAM-dependent methyltransferase